MRAWATPASWGPAGHGVRRRRAGWSIGEPVAWRGPVVMNTDEELREAFCELNEGDVREEARVAVGRAPG